MKQRKIFIHHKLRENAINHIEEKENAINHNEEKEEKTISVFHSQNNIVVNDIKKSNFNSLTNLNKRKKRKNKL